MLIKVEMIGLTSTSELSYQPCQAHAFLSGVRDGHRTYPQFIYPCAEQFEQPVLDLVLGIGTGSPEMAKQIYGEEMGSPLAYLREYLQVLHPLLRQGEVHHHGHFFTTEVSLAAPGQIPLFIAALGPRAFRQAGELADGALPFLCPIPYLLNTALPALSEGATAAGRPRPPVVAHVPVALTHDRATALQAERRQDLAFHTTLKPYRNMFAAAGFSLQEIDGVSDTLVESLLVFGDEDQPIWGQATEGQCLLGQEHGMA